MPKPKATDANHGPNKLQTKVSFSFTEAESELLHKIASALLKTKEDQRLAFLLVGRWTLANWNRVEPCFKSDIHYSKSEGVPLFDLIQSKIAKQSKLL